MDIYDVIEALRRQRVLLVVGLVLLVVVLLAGMFTIDDGSLRQRFAPRYEAVTQMVVVPQGVEELTNPDLTSGDFSSVAAVYADLLSTERALEEITELSGSRVDAITVTASNRSPLIKVQVEAPTAAESSKAAVTAFAWLEDRLQTGGTVASVTTTPPIDPKIDTSITQIVVRSEPTFIDTDPNIWIAIQTAQADGVASPLYALETDTVFEASTGPREPITITVGPEIGRPDDTARVLTPALNEEELERLPPLEVLLRRGSIVFDAEGVPSINASAIGVDWEPITEEIVEVQAVTVMLLDDQPVPILIGQRRGPIIAAGALIAGILALLVLALMRDTWQVRKRATAVPVAAVPDPIEEHEPLQPWEHRKAVD